MKKQLLFALGILLYSLSPNYLLSQCEASDTCPSILEAINVENIEVVRTDYFENCFNFCIGEAQVENSDLPGAPCIFLENPTVWHVFELEAEADIFQVKVNSSGNWIPVFSVYHGDCNQLIQSEDNFGSLPCSNLDNTPDVLHIDIQNIPSQTNSKILYVAVSSLSPIVGNTDYEICVSSYQNLCDISPLLNHGNDTIFSLVDRSISQDLSGPLIPGEEVTICYDFRFSAINSDWLQAIFPDFGSIWDLNTFNYTENAHPGFEWIDQQDSCANIIQEDLAYICSYKDSDGLIKICNLIYENCPCSEGMMAGDSLQSGWYYLTDGICLNDCRPYNRYGWPGTIHTLSSCFDMKVKSDVSNNEVNNSSNSQIKLNFMTDEVTGCWNFPSANCLDNNYIISKKWQICPTSQTLIENAVTCSYTEYNYDLELENTVYDSISVVVRKDDEVEGAQNYNYNSTNGEINDYLVNCNDSSQIIIYNISYYLNDVCPVLTKTLSLTIIPKPVVIADYVNSCDGSEIDLELTDFLDIGIMNELVNIRWLLNGVTLLGMTENISYLPSEFDTYIELLISTDNGCSYSYILNINHDNFISLIGGTVWIDENGNSLQEAEKVVSNIEINIQSTDQSYFARSYTDINGNYSFLVEEGIYDIFIAASEFENGGTLSNSVEECLLSVSADNEIDQDNNGAYNDNFSTIVVESIPLICQSSSMQIAENHTYDICLQKKECTEVNTANLVGTCDEVITNYPEYTICDMNILDGFCGTMRANLPNGVTGQVCEDGGDIDNPSWFAFVAGTGSYNMLIIPSNCSEDPNNPGNFDGMQVAVYSDCGLEEARYCNSECNLDTVVVPSIFTAGRTYYVLLDGCASSVCDFEVRVECLSDICTSVSFEEPTAWNISDCNAESSICKGSPYDITVDGYQVNQDTMFYWQVKHLPSEQPDIITTDSFSLAYTFEEIGLYEICLTLEHGCANAQFCNVVNVIPDIEICFPEVILCSGASIIPETTVDGSDYSWPEAIIAPENNGNENLILELETNVNDECGCNTQYKIEIIIPPSYQSNLTVEVCTSDFPVIIESQEITSEGSYTISLSSISNCDSIINLEVVAVEDVVTTLDTSVCENNFPIEIYDSLIVSAGLYEFLIEDIQECSTTAIVHVISSNISNVQIDTLLCQDQFPFIYMDTTITEAGEYLFQVNNIEDCDSLITLNISADIVAAPIITCESTDTSILFSWQDDENIVAYIISYSGTILEDQTENSLSIDNLMSGELLEITVQSINENGCLSLATSITCMTDLTDASNELLKSKFKIFPNPATDRIVIEYPTEKYNSEIEIFTINGNSVMKAELEPSIDISYLESGTYILKIISNENKETSFIKFVVIN